MFRNQLGQFTTTVRQICTIVGDPNGMAIITTRIMEIIQAVHTGAAMRVENPTTILTFKRNHFTASRL